MQGFTQEPKKSINIKNLGRNPPSQTPQGTPDPAKFFMLGPLFPSEYRKKAYTKHFERGVLGPQSSLCWISSRAFFAPDLRWSKKNPRPARRSSPSGPKGLGDTPSDTLKSPEETDKSVVFYKIGNGRNTVSRVLFRRRELTEPHSILGQTR